MIVGDRVRALSSNLGPTARANRIHYPASPPLRAFCVLVRTKPLAIGGGARFAPHGAAPVVACRTVARTSASSESGGLSRIDPHEEAAAWGGGPAVEEMGVFAGAAE